MAVFFAGMGRDFNDVDKGDGQVTRDEVFCLKLSSIGFELMDLDKDSG